ncbi:MAG: hydroxyacid dehydrogenase [Rhodospirillales bacterium]
MKANLVYFDRWMDPIGPEIINASGSFEMTKLSFKDAPEINWKAFEKAHAYQALPSTETEKLFYPRRDMVKRCPDLLAVSVSGAGYDMVDLDACTEAGILVVNQTGANAESVAQHAIGLMLNLSKKINQSDRATLRDGRDWSRWTYTGAELTGRTLGIVGLGKIGRRVSEIAKVFSMNVIAYDPYLTNTDFAERGAKSVSLEELCKSSDFVTVHCPLTDDSANMIGAKQYNAMKPSAFFIQTARGGIHDEVALENAIANNKIAGAGLDVFMAEPAAHDHPLIGYDNVIATPHNAGITTDCLFNMGKWSADQWLDIWAGKRPPRFKNPDVWAKYSERFKAITGRAVID